MSNHDFKRYTTDTGFGPRQVMEVILGVSLKTLSNYTNHLTEPEPNPELLKMITS